MKFRTAYSPRKAGEFSKSCANGRTRQQDKDSCDINLIMARYQKSGLLPQGRAVPVYMDISEVEDLRTTLDRVREAETYFRSLPAEWRQRFNHSVDEFMAAPTSDAGRSQLKALEAQQAREAAREVLRKTAEADRLNRELRSELGLDVVATPPGGAASGSAAP